MKAYLFSWTKIYLIIFCVFFTQAYTPSLPKPQLHVFLDAASSPVLLQMIEFIRLPIEDKKIIAWDRNRHLSKYIKLSDFNAEEISYYLPGKNQYDTLWTQVLEKINQELQENPDTEITIYTNLYHVDILLFRLLNKIPHKNIRHIHLYEDGHGNTIASRFNQVSTYKTDLKSKPKKFKSKNDGYYLGLFFPTTFHLGFKNQIKTNKKLQDLYRLMTSGMGSVQDVDFKKIKEHLSTQEKKLLATVLGFNPEKYKNQLLKYKGKTAIYLSSPAFFKEDYLKEIEIFKKIYSIAPNLIYLKPHPYSSSENMTKILRNEYPNLIIYPSRIPIEAFYLTDTLPDYIMGYGSSAFLSLPREKILFYIKRTQTESYFPFLIRSGLIKKNQAFDIKTDPDEFIPFIRRLKP